MIEPKKPDMPSAAAEAFLKWKFSSRDANRMKALAAKARKKALTEKESRELQIYTTVSEFRSVLQKKAKLTLKALSKKNVARARHR